MEAVYFLIVLICMIVCGVNGERDHQDPNFVGGCMFGLIIGVIIVILIALLVHGLK